jgi:hypothetical protein
VEKPDERAGKDSYPNRTNPRRRARRSGMQEGAGACGNVGAKKSFARCNRLVADRQSNHKLMQSCDLRKQSRASSINLGFLDCNEENACYDFDEEWSVLISGLTI